MGRVSRVLCCSLCLVLAAACADDEGPATVDAAVDMPPVLFVDGPGGEVSYPDGSRRDGSRRDGSRRDGSSSADAAGDARRPDLLAPDTLSPDVLPADVLPPDTLAHKCRTFGEFVCSGSSSFISCLARCTDHRGRKLQITCLNTNMCICLVNGKNKKTCNASGSSCSRCQQALSCCNFPAL